MNRQAQTNLEWAFLVVIIIAAGLAMQGYLKASVSGNWKANSNTFSEGQFDNDLSRSESAISYSKHSMAMDFGADGSFEKNFNFNSPSEQGLLKINNWGSSNPDLNPYNNAKDHK